jgi:hypothetical protein
VACMHSITVDQVVDAVLRKARVSLGNRPNQDRIIAVNPP